MAFSFGDGFDLYAAPADALNGYWDSGSTSGSFVIGRFSGSRAYGSGPGSLTAGLVKSSGSNDAVHHVAVAYQQTSAVSGVNPGAWITFSDGATAQCTIVFRQDGTILLVSGVYNSGTTLATYSGAFPVASTWYSFECEVVINNTTGSFAVRKNGNTSNDFTLGSLNTYSTRPSCSLLAVRADRDDPAGLLDDEPESLDPLGADQIDGILEITQPLGPEKCPRRHRFGNLPPGRRLRSATACRTSVG